jgi:hypothetical protein
VEERGQLEKVVRFPTSRVCFRQLWNGETTRSFHRIPSHSFVVLILRTYVVEVGHRCGRPEYATGNVL